LSERESLSDAAYQAWHDEPSYAIEIAAAVPAGRLVVDLGGGTGWLSRYLSPDVDYVLGEVEGAARVARDMKVRAVIALDLTRPLPFASSLIDVIVLRDVLEHLPAPLGLVHECARVLRPDGALMASVPMPSRGVWDDYTHIRPFTKRGISRLLQDGGFCVESFTAESVLPGVGRWASSLGRGHRPAPAHWAARMGLGPRNAVILAKPLA
jgi:SAM-dependent methyltransferase